MKNDKMENMAVRLYAYLVAGISFGICPFNHSTKCDDCAEFHGIKTRNNCPCDYFGCEEAVKKAWEILGTFGYENQSE